MGAADHFPHRIEVCRVDEPDGLWWFRMYATNGDVLDAGLARSQRRAWRLGRRSWKRYAKARRSFG